MIESKVCMAQDREQRDGRGLPRRLRGVSGPADAARSPEGKLPTEGEHAPLGSYRVASERVRQGPVVPMRKSPMGGTKFGRRRGDATAEEEESGAGGSSGGGGFRPSVLASAAMVWLVVGLLVSVAFHVGLSVAVADIRLAFLDPGSSAPRESTPVRIKRARFDTVRSAADVERAVGVSLSEGLKEQDVPVPVALDEVLALRAEPALLDQADPLEAMQDVRELADPEMTDALDTGFAIDPALLATLAFETPEPMLPSDTPVADASRPGAGVGDVGGELSAALLAASRGSSVRSGVGGAGGEAPAGGLRALDRRPGTGANGLGTGGGGALSGERRALPTATESGIDFAALAVLDATTQLAPPEHLDDDFAYALSTWADPQRTNEPAFFRIDISAQRSLRKLATMPKDLVFLIDTSSSIPQRWVEQIALGVEQALVSLNEGDRFNIVLFADEVGFLFEQGPQQATTNNIKAASAFLRSARSKGYTDVNAAVRRMLTRDNSGARVYSMVLISDGLPTVGVVDSRELINLITRENDGSADIYCVGVGERRRMDPRMLDFLAYRNRGFSVIADGEKQVAVVIRDLASRLRFPIITDVSVQVAGRRATDVFPAVLPSIHQGQAFALYGRYSGEGPLTFRVTGRSADGKPVDFTFGQDPAQAPRGGADIAQGWAFWKLHHLYSEVLRLGQRDDLLQQMRALEQRFGLKALY